MKHKFSTLTLAYYEFTTLLLAYSIVQHSAWSHPPMWITMSFFERAMFSIFL